MMNPKMTHKRAARRLALLLLITLGIITQTACESQNDVTPVEKDGYYLDTVCKLSIYEINGGLDEEEANKAMEAAYDRCRELDKTLSNTVEVSEVSQINNAGGQWVTVGKDTLTVIQVGIKYGDLSDGDFDITMGTVTDLWDWHSDEPKLPKEDELAEALTHVDYHQIQINGDQVRLTDPQAKLDLGGIAKGYIADEMTRVLEDQGVTSAIVNLGGNIVAIGSKPNGDPFTVGIEKPYSDRSEIVGSTTAKDQTVVTSGVYERQFKVNGKTYYHILDPKTGYPAETDLDATSLVAGKGHSIDIDAMSTITLIKGSREGKKFVESQDGIEAIFCPTKGDITKTRGMKFDAE